jgi:hypothetical protein
MKVIFLDIDGVLNTKETYDNMYRTKGFLSVGEIPIDKFRLEYLKTIIDETDAKIVLSSSFRNFFIKQEDELVPTSLKGRHLYNWFLRYGIDIYDITPTNGNKREDEIKQWLFTHDDIEDFIVIDDDPTIFDDLSSKLRKVDKALDVGAFAQSKKELKDLGVEGIDNAENLAEIEKVLKGLDNEAIAPVTAALNNMISSLDELEKEQKDVAGEIDKTTEVLKE